MVHLLKSRLLGPGKPLLYVVMELSLIAFESQHLLGLVLNEYASNLLLASHRIYGHDATCYM